MIGNSNDLKRAFGIDVVMSPEMAGALQRWDALYRNKPHHATSKLKAINLPAAIASEIARSVTIEMKAEITGSAHADYLNETLQEFLSNIRQDAEFACAKGSVVFRPYVYNGKLCIDVIQADQFYPITFDDKRKVTSCIFADQRQIGQWFYTRLEYHRFDAKGDYIITNAVFKSSSRDSLGVAVPFNSIPDWAELEEEATITGLERPLYGYFRYPMANNIDPKSPMGVSCFSRAAEAGLFKKADEQFDRIMWEAESGERLIFAELDAYEKGTDGKPKLPDNRLYRALENTGEVGGTKKLFEEFSPELRTDPLIRTFDSVLKQIEWMCGLAQGTISDPNTIALTATEIKMSQQRTAATITDCQKGLEDTIDDLVYAMSIWTQLFNLAPLGTYETSYDFDDSIVVDHEAQFTQDSSAVGMQVMSKLEFRMRNYNETEEQAAEALKKVTTEQQEYAKLFPEETAVIE